MKSALMLAALCAGLCVSAPAVQAKGPSDAELFCKLWPVSAKCHTTSAKITPVAMVTKPAAAMKPAHLKMLSCVKATDKKYFYSCSWK
ncbi:MAG TPA: hypothetical protein VGO70_03230 [Arsenicitalea sp.]|nr:hypothetical protein [Arsenicitalea sp.]